MIRPRRRVEPDTCLVTVVSCGAAALTADNSGQPFDDLVPNTELSENPARDAVTITRQCQEQMLRTHKAQAPGLRFARRLDDHAAGPWRQRIERKCHTLMFAPVATQSPPFQRKGVDAGPATALGQTAAAPLSAWSTVPPRRFRDPRH